MPTLASLVASSKVTGDFENNDSVTDPAWILFVNRAHEELYDLVAQMDPRRFHATHDFALTASDNEEALPENFLRLIRPGVMKDPTLTTRRRIRRFNPSDVDRLGDLAYDMPGANLTIEPKERCAGNYRMFYASTVTPMVDAGDPMDTRLDQWVEFLEVSAAIAARGSKNLDATWLEKRLVKVLERIELTPERDTANPEAPPEPDEDLDADYWLNFARRST